MFTALIDGILGTPVTKLDIFEALFFLNSSIFNITFPPYLLFLSSALLYEIWETTDRLCAMPQAVDRYVYNILYCECLVVNQSGCFITKAKSLKLVFYVITGGNQIRGFAVCKSKL